MVVVNKNKSDLEGGCVGVKYEGFPIGVFSEIVTNNGTLWVFEPERFKKFSVNVLKDIITELESFNKDYTETW